MKKGIKVMASAEDARLILQLYDLRREKVMRRARKFLLAEFHPQSIDDIRAVLSHPKKGAYYRQVTSFWDMAAALVNHGAINAELFYECGGEYLGVWAKVSDFVPQMRQEIFSPLYLANLERLIENQPNGAERVQFFKAFFRRMAEQKPAKGKSS